MKFYAYIYRNPINNAPFYVGKGHGARYRKHLSGNAVNPRMSRRVAKMLLDGVAPKVEVIEALDEGHAFFLEQCLIDVIGRADLAKGPLLNLTNGGEGASGAVHSEASKVARRKPKPAGFGAAVSAAKSGIPSGRAGLPLSAPHRLAIGESRRGCATSLKGKATPRITCDRCGETGGAYGMKRWHFDNCQPRGRNSFTARGNAKLRLLSCPHCPKTGGANGMNRYHFDACKFKKGPL